ncbi:hypothetical protein BCV72DRAFT_218192 [Rhizopus microsporus var. microsporus]|uniref:Tc1-like transposase DDE domain-containing protein n=1 Tax=Rhizopus microsporus var. microsporus TaxID=86635 RepID=A0A1X0QMH5_RHIZD|nr:hypothetical protein BCV72DRAFT_218192 [Rhizopus microsporus var. microsporus]
MDEEGKEKCLAKGTTTYRIVKFAEVLVDVLDRHEKIFIVMDNCRIRHSSFALDAINKRGYKHLFFYMY